MKPWCDPEGEARQGEARDPGTQLELSHSTSILAVIKSVYLQLETGPMGTRIQVSALSQERGQGRVW